MPYAIAFALSGLNKTTLIPNSKLTNKNITKN